MVTAFIEDPLSSDIEALALSSVKEFYEYAVFDYEINSYGNVIFSLLPQCSQTSGK